MANARKCDRCGSCFDHFNAPESVEMVRFQNPCFQTSADVRKHTVTRKLFNDDSPDAFVDLCPNCTRDFEKFMTCARLEDETRLHEMEEELDFAWEEIHRLENALAEKSEEKKEKTAGFPELYNMTFDTLDKAKKVSDQLHDILDTYACVYIMDVFDVADYNYSYYDGWLANQYGWKNLDDLKIVAAESGWKLVFPDPVLLTEDSPKSPNKPVYTSHYVTDYNKYCINACKQYLKDHRIKGANKNDI